MNLAQVAQRQGISYSELKERLAGRPSRRSFLKGAGAAAMALPLLSACGDDDDDKKVVVIGGGLAGLHCAYRLDQAGVNVTVYEASNRVGGRTFTGRGLFANGQTCELGGEFIDSGHVAMQALAQEFGLTLDDTRDGTENLLSELYFFNNRVVTEEELVDMFTPVASEVTAAVEQGEESDAFFERVDNMSVDQWLANESSADPLLQKIINSAYVSEYGLDIQEQSAWNMLYLIGADEPDPFRIYGVSDEIYHLREGSDAIATAMANRLSRHIETEKALTKVVANADGRYTVSFARGDDVTADHVVFALPFKLLREVDLSRAGVSRYKQDVIATLGYGTNAKLMGGFSERFWETQHQSTGTTFSDLGTQETWDSSRGQSGATGILTEFVGGQRGVAIGNGAADARMRAILPQMEAMFPGISEKYVGDSAQRMHWPTVPFNKGSYACYHPGQYAFNGTEGEREGNLHFCGEHTSIDNQGFMEGAAETGARAADEILGNADNENALTLRIASARLAKRFARRA